MADAHPATCSRAIGVPSVEKTHEVPCPFVSRLLLSLSGRSSSHNLDTNPGPTPGFRVSHSGLPSSFLSSNNDKSPRRRGTVRTLSRTEAERAPPSRSQLPTSPWCLARCFPPPADDAGLAPRPEAHPAGRPGAGRSSVHAPGGPPRTRACGASRPARHLCPPVPLLTDDGPRRRPHTRRTAGAALAVPGCSARPCGAAASRMAARRRRGLRARERARGRGTGGRGPMGSEFGVPRPPARPNQVADRRAPLCREYASGSSGPPCLRK